MSIPSVLLVSYFLFSYVGVAIHFFQLDPFRLSYGATDKYILLRLLCYTAMGFLGLVVGCWLFNKFFGPIPQHVKIEYASKYTTVTFLFTIILFVLCVVAYGYYLRRVPGIALLAAFNHNVDTQYFLRSQMTNALYAYGFAWGPLLYNDVLTFICFLLMSQGLYYKKISYIVFFVIVFIFAVIVGIADSQKAPFMYLLVGLLLTWVLTSNGGKLSNDNVTVIVITILFSFITVSRFLLSGFSGFFETMFYAFTRIVGGASLVGYFYVLMFPASHPFLCGKSISNLHGFLPFDQFHITTEVYRFLRAGSLDSTIVGTAPTSFWGEAYANFDVYGIVPLALLLGMYSCFLQRVVFSFKLSPLTIALLVWVMLHMQFLSITGFSNYVIDQHMAVVAIVFLSYYWIEKKFCQPHDAYM